MKTHYKHPHHNYTLCGLKYEKDHILKLALVTFGATCKNCVKACENLLKKQP